MEKKDLHFIFVLLRRTYESALRKYAPLIFLDALGGGFQLDMERLAHHRARVPRIRIRRGSDCEAERKTNIGLVDMLLRGFLYFLGFVEYAEGVALNTKMSCFFPGYDQLVISFIVGSRRLWGFALGPCLGCVSSLQVGGLLFLKKSHLRIAYWAPAF
jgi:hypothetical protein